MALCLNRDGLEYSTLAKMSGIPGFKLDVMVSHYLEKYGRFPRLHELPGSDSSKYLLKRLNANSTELDGMYVMNVDFNSLANYLELKDISKLSELDIAKILNTKHSDLLISVSIGLGTISITYRKLPTKYDSIIQENRKFVENSSLANVRVINNIIENTLNFSGVSIIPITDAELSTPLWRNVLMGRSTAKAFVYQGNVYINTDHATIDDRLHELLHIVLGTIAANEDPNIRKIYTLILQTLENSIDWETEGKLNYPNRTKYDILEEILVREISKHVVGLKSKIQDLPDSIQEELFAGIAQAFDRALIANNSSTTLDPKALLTGSLYDLCVYLLDKSLILKSKDYSQLRRRVANTAENLIKSKKLERNCN